ncbi:MAG TPA: hypothetical protein PL110_15780 [Candidatus Eremiobacteraeota bacterium]|nr:hypothetical protein [Candidatus Eremiobacteraeota bacterium]
MLQSPDRDRLVRWILTCLLQYLEGITSELFTLKQKEFQRDADNLEKKLKHMGEVIAEREKNKDIIIKDPVDKLTGKSEYLKW